MRTTVRVMTRPTDIADFLPRWRQLLELAEPAGPFSAPDDLLVWASVHLPRSARVQIVSLWQDEVLIAVAPMFRRFLLWSRAMVSVHPLGNLCDPVITELPEVLCRPGFAPVALRELVAHFAATHGVMWTELPFTATQGWPVLPPDGGGPRPGVALVHKVVRPSVVLRVDPADWGSELPRVKRNLRESLRRSRNRMRALDAPVRISWDGATGNCFGGALRDLKVLHRTRSGLSGPSHEDVFRRPGTERFLRAVGQGASSPGWEIGRLWVADRPVAALLTVSTPAQLWLSISGMDATGAELSAVTWLQSEAIRRASAAGVTEAAFSIGVDTAKLRWSEQVRSHHEFFLVSRTPFALATFALYQVARTVRTVLGHRRGSGSSR